MENKETYQAGETIDELVTRLRTKQRDLIREWDECDEDQEADHLLIQAAKIDRVIKMLLGR